MILQDYFTIEKFLNENDLDVINNTELSQQLFFDNPKGVHKGEQTALQEWIETSSDLGKHLTQKFKNIEYFNNLVVDGFQVYKAINPYDVHSDYILTDNQEPKSDPNAHKPAYTVVIPLVDPGTFKTIVFDQSATYNNFSEFKNKNPKLENHVPDNTWEELCGHCHKEDQQWLTIKTIYNWEKGSLFAFNRELFHSSGNFLEADAKKMPRRAIIAWLSQ